MRKLFFKNALLPGGWARDVAVVVSEAGEIVSVERGQAPGRGGWDGAIAVAGLPNMHSHGFQRALAGRTERRDEGEDSFWSWRAAMYAFLDRLSPEDVAAITAMAYVEMLESGFTAVGEFHYLHNTPRGRPYGERGAMAEAVAEAAGRAGLGLTLLPVYYAQGGFDGAEPEPAQRRFVTDRDRFVRLLEAAETALKPLADARLGVAPHSLRAVSPDDLGWLAEARPGDPVHIHIAEQTREVEDCLAWSGQRPVEWLLGHAAVDARWCLVHATHMSGDESRAAARSGATVCVCPITEANLGDGIFDAPGFLEAGGAIAVGSDSNVLISAAEELRWLEYAQRLRDRARNRLAAPGRSTGRSLHDAACAGGAQASGRRIGRIAPGFRADIVTLDAESAALAGLEDDGWLDGWVFAGSRSCVESAWVGGDPVVAAGRHLDRDAVAAAFRATMTRLSKRR